MNKDFRTQYDRVNRVFTSSGSPVKIRYGASYDEKGRLKLEEEGTVNLYDEIQSFADSVNIHVIMKRFVNGEVDVLTKVQGFYGDITEFPSTYADVLNVVNSGEKMFAELPIEVRAKFDHNFGQFVAAIGSDEWFSALGIVKEPLPSPSGGDPSPSGGDPSPSGGDPSPSVVKE